MSRRLEIIILVLVALGAAGAGAGAALYFAYPNQVQLAAGEARAYLLSFEPASRHGEDGGERGIQGCSDTRLCRRNSARRSGRRLAELQQNADFGAILRAHSDQCK